MSESFGGFGNRRPGCGGRGPVTGPRWVGWNVSCSAERGHASTNFRGFAKPLAASQDTKPVMRIVCVSDTHARHHLTSLPPGDVLVHAGDITRHGALEDVEAFDAWLGTLDYRHKVVI